MEELCGFPRLDADGLCQIQLDDITSRSVIGTSQDALDRRKGARMVDERGCGWRFREQAPKPSSASTK